MTSKNVVARDQAIELLKLALSSGAIKLHRNGGNYSNAESIASSDAKYIERFVTDLSTFLEKQ